MKLKNILLRVENCIRECRTKKKARRIRRQNEKLLNRMDVNFDESLTVNGILHISGSGHLIIGEGVTINSGGEFNPAAGSGETYFNLYGGDLILGNRVGISNAAITSTVGITIEDDVAIGAGTMISDTDFHPIDFKDRSIGNDCAVKTAPITIKKGAFIGAKSIILKGVVIGEEAVIGAGSVVTKTVPNREIWAGNPAKCVGKVGERND